MNAYPLLCVPGIDDTSARFNKMRAALLKRGVDRVAVLDIIPSDGSIAFEVMAGQVQAAAQTLQQTTPAAKIDIVAFSMGTLAVRYYLQRLGGRSLVRRFISIAGPHHGTLMAYLRQNIGCRQMRPGSAWLRDLSADKNAWGGVEVFSFWTPLDLMIVPAHSSILEQGQTRTFGVLLHPWMLSDKRVIEAVAQTLTAPDKLIP